LGVRIPPSAQTKPRQKPLLTWAFLCPARPHRPTTRAPTLGHGHGCGQERSRTIAAWLRRVPASIEATSRSAAAHTGSGSTPASTRSPKSPCTSGRPSPPEGTPSARLRRRSPGCRTRLTRDERHGPPPLSTSCSTATSKSDSTSPQGPDGTTPARRASTFARFSDRPRSRGFRLTRLSRFTLTSGAAVSTATGGTMFSTAQRTRTSATSTVRPDRAQATSVPKPRSSASRWTTGAYVFSIAPDHGTFLDPSTTHRFERMARRLGIDSTLHKLMHYSSTELLNAGVNIRVVAGRLGHGGGGATTLRVYAAWLAEADQRAAPALAGRMPARPAGILANGPAGRASSDVAEEGSVRPADVNPSRPRLSLPAQPIRIFLDSVQRGLGSHADPGECGKQGSRRGR
jgi:hypothetical protein